MLTSIEIKGLAVIEKADISFGQGLNIITGETGAGKSILVKALSFILGQKADAGMIRSDADSASVAAEFLIPTDHPVVSNAKSLGISTAEDEVESSLLIRRTIQKNGRSKAWINDHMITLSTLREVVAPLIDLFSQHESHNMLNPKHHVEYLDKFLKDTSVKTRFQNCYFDVHTKVKELSHMIGKCDRLRRDEDYLKFRMREFEELNPSIADYEKLLEDVKQAEGFLKLAEKTSEARLLVDQLAELQHVVTPLLKSLRDMSLTSKNFKEPCETGENLMELLNDWEFQCARALDSLDEDSDLDPESLQSRLADYQSMMRKTNAQNIEELVAKFEKLGNDLELIANLEKGVQKLLEEINKAVKTLKSLASKLSEARRYASKKVESALESELKSLVMPEAKVKVAFDKIHTAVAGIKEDQKLTENTLWQEIAEELSCLNSQGNESVCFELSANPGEKLQPLHKVVSGGELSRIMLALKKALAAGANTCVLVFDEIDTGISGKIADVVGKKLDQLSQNFQIVCISHLPQVAAYADTHFLVSKHQTKTKSSTVFRELDQKERENEIARLLSGTKITKSSLENARSLLAKNS